MRSKLQRQLKMLKSGEMSMGTPASGTTEATIIRLKTEATIIRLKKWSDELNALLKEYTRADRT